MSNLSSAFERPSDGPASRSVSFGNHWVSQPCCDTGWFGVPFWGIAILRDILGTTWLERTPKTCPEWNSRRRPGAKSLSDTNVRHSHACRAIVWRVKGITERFWGRRWSQRFRRSPWVWAWIPLQLLIQQRCSFLGVALDMLWGIENKQRGPREGSSLGEGVKNGVRGTQH